MEHQLSSATDHDEPNSEIIVAKLEEMSEVPDTSTDKADNTEKRKPNISNINPE